MSKRITHPTKKLSEAGFAPAADCRKIAGCWQSWNHTDGRKATIGYKLFSRTGQSSVGAAADWGYTVEVEKRGA